jgi:NAD(P)-dependent dehydrogenase (short-subunit alcohol dehydrogenase family)
LKEAAEECERAGAAGVSVEPADVGDDDAVAAVIRRVLEDHGRLDAAVSVASVVAYGALPSVPVEVFDGVVRTNLLGSANLARHVLPVFRAQGRGHLVLTGSVLGHLAVPGMTAYIVSKWGVRAPAFAFMPAVYDALVGPLFAVAALERAMPSRRDPAAYWPRCQAVVA